MAVEGEHETIVKMLLEREDIDVNCQNGSGNTALMLVAWYGHGAIFKMLLERGDIDVNCKDGDGDTALSRAI